MRTKRETWLLFVFSLVAVFCATPAGGGFETALWIVGVWANCTCFLWDERRKRINAEKEVEDIRATAARMLIDQADGATMSIVTPGCDCNACVIKRSRAGGLPP